MRIIKLRNNRYKVESSSKGKFYSVDLNAPFCDCPQFMFREKARGGKCKHILAIEEKCGNRPKQKVSQKTLSSFSRIIDEVRKNCEIETVVLMEKYGEKEVQELIGRGELIEIKGKVRITE